MINKIHNVDCIVGMKCVPDNSVDLVVTSPPYNVNIKYDVYDDKLSMDEYFKWVEEWLTEVYRTLKDDGRIALNIPYEINVRERGGRIYMSSEYWQIMKKVGFKFFGLVDLEESSPHRSKTTAWGSYMSSSGPYIYNPKECVILAYKKNHIKQSKGVSDWKFLETITETGKKKKIYNEKDKEEFMELVFGQWKYMADTQSLTKATFSSDIPLKAIKILSYVGDVVMDPFSGSGTTCLISEVLNRNWIGFEISEEYSKISINRISKYRESKHNLFQT
jgi:site-specific DNA-methyltransferase (adenine-specific)